MSYFVTGAAGFLGRYLVSALLKRKGPIHVLVRKDSRKKLDAMNTAYARVGSVVSAVAELDAIDGKSLVGDYKPDDIGVGIAQGNHPDIGEGAVWIVVLIAERLPAKTPTKKP